MPKSSACTEAAGLCALDEDRTAISCWEVKESDYRLDLTDETGVLCASSHVHLYSVDH
jgi:hypothetical protein